MERIWHKERIIMNLDKYGFLQAGEWKAYANVRSGITFEISDSRFENERVVYAFVVNETVKYIGVCEKNSTTLKDRMSRYKNMQGGGTNERIAELIKLCLDEEKVVKIFILETDGSYKYKGLAVDLVKGLENPLIQEFQPEWNIHK